VPSDIRQGAPAAVSSARALVNRPSFDRPLLARRTFVPVPRVHRREPPDAPFCVGSGRARACWRQGLAAAGLQQTRRERAPGERAPAQGRAAAARLKCRTSGRALKCHRRGGRGSLAALLKFAGAFGRRPLRTWEVVWGPARGVHTRAPWAAVRARRRRPIRAPPPAFPSPHRTRFSARRAGLWACTYARVPPGPWPGASCLRPARGAARPRAAASRHASSPTAAARPAQCARAAWFKARHAQASARLRRRA
jgi:hypothetical protein